MNEKLNSYWNRPGGKFGTVMGIAALGAIAWYVFPIVTTMAWNTVECAWALAAALVTAYILTNRKLRLGLFYIWEIAMKALQGLVMQMDPFIISEDNIATMKKDRSKLLSKIQEIGGKRAELDMRIKKKQEELGKASKMVQSAKERTTPMAADIAAAEARKAGRVHDSLTIMVPLRDDILKAETYLQQIYDKSEIYIEDAQDELNNARELYTATTLGRSALATAVRLFEGDPEKRLLAEQSMLKVQATIGNNLSQMKQSMRVTTNFLERLDIESGAYEAKGLEVLREISATGFVGSGTTSAGAHPSALGSLLNS